MKEPLRGIRFRTVPEILQAVDRSIRTINTTGACDTGDTAHIDTIFMFLPHTRQYVGCVART